MALQMILIKIPLVILKILSMYFKFYLGINIITSYTLLVVPRLIMCALSFLNDYSLYKICCSYGIQYKTRLIALASSFVMLVFGTRTFSNSIEMTICSVLLYYVSECMINSNTVIYQKEVLEDKFNEAKTPVERVFFLKMKLALPGHSLNGCLIIATLCVVGCFNRPTFLFFGLPIVFFWLHRGMGTKVVTFFDFHLRIIYFLICAIPSFMICVLIDSCYYEYLTAAEMDQQDIGIKNFVLTPWNFVKYNIDPSKTAEHGVHPKYLHLLVNIPLLFNILGVVCIFSIGTMMVRYVIFFKIKVNYFINTNLNKFIFQIPSRKLPFTSSNTISHKSYDSYYMCPHSGSFINKSSGSTFSHSINIAHHYTPCTNIKNGFYSKKSIQIRKYGNSIHIRQMFKIQK